MKNKIFLALLITNFLLVSCSNTVSINDNLQKNQLSNTNQNTQTGILANSKYTPKNNSVYYSSDGVKVKIIKVDNKCIGCGKCTRIDPSHFSMNYNTHKAKATQTNGHYGPLQQAIGGCPVGAISVS